MKGEIDVASIRPRTISLTAHQRNARLHRRKRQAYYRSRGKPRERGLRCVAARLHERLMYDVGKTFLDRPTAYFVRRPIRTKRCHRSSNLSSMARSISSAMCMAKSRLFRSSCGISVTIKMARTAKAGGLCLLVI